MFEKNWITFGNLCNITSIFQFYEPFNNLRVYTKVLVIEIVRIAYKYTEMYENLMAFETILGLIHHIYITRVTQNNTGMYIDERSQQTFELQNQQFG